MMLFEMNIVIGFLWKWIVITRIFIFTESDNWSNETIVFKTMKLNTDFTQNEAPDLLF